jgi:hypothetical protein
MWRAGDQAIRGGAREDQELRQPSGDAAPFAR